MITNLLLLVGTIIGAGIFSLPYVFQNLHWYYLPLLLFLTIISIFLSLFYLSIIKRVGKKHQLPGYLTIVLGKNWGRLSSFLLLFSTGGALLGYLILGGRFINNTAIFYLVAASGYLFNPKLVEEWSDFLTGLLIIGLLGLILKTIHPFKLKPTTIETSLVLEGYGTLLFSLTGFSIIPELDDKDKKIYSSIIIAYTIVFLLYLAFAVFVSPDHSLLLSLIGFLAIITSYLPLSLVFEDVLSKDLLLSKKTAKLLTLILPISLYLLGFHNFLSIFSFTGAVFIGSLSLLILFAYTKIKPKRSLIENLALFLCSITFLIGLIGEIILKLLAKL